MWKLHPGCPWARNASFWHYKKHLPICKDPQSLQSGTSLSLSSEAFYFLTLVISSSLFLLLSKLFLSMRPFPQWNSLLHKQLIHAFCQRHPCCCWHICSLLSPVTALLKAVPILSTSFVWNWGIGEWGCDTYPRGFLFQVTTYPKDHWHWFQ